MERTETPHQSFHFSSSHFKRTRHITETGMSNFILARSIFSSHERNYERTGKKKEKKNVRTNMGIKKWKEESKVVWTNAKTNECNKKKIIIMKRERERRYKRATENTNSDERKRKNERKKTEERADEGKTERTRPYDRANEPKNEPTRARAAPARATGVKCL